MAASIIGAEGGHAFSAYPTRHNHGLIHVSLRHRNRWTQPVLAAKIASGARDAQGRGQFAAKASGVRRAAKQSASGFQRHRRHDQPAADAHTIEASTRGVGAAADGRCVSGLGEGFRGPSRGFGFTTSSPWKRRKKRGPICGGCAAGLDRGRRLDRNGAQRWDRPKSIRLRTEPDPAPVFHKQFAAGSGEAMTALPGRGTRLLADFSAVGARTWHREDLRRAMNLVRRAPPLPRDATTLRFV